MQGWWMGELRIVRIIQNNTETVIEEEGRRTFEVIYEGPTVNFASVGLDASQSIDITKQSI
jgi:hypothetical protein